MFTIGIDVHSRTHSMCILDPKGKLLRRIRVRGGLDQLVEAVAGAGEPLRVCFEASLDCGLLHDRLSSLPNVREIVVAHPAHLRRSHCKNDRVDAERLAVNAFHGWVDGVHVPSPAVRQLRQLVEFRCRQVRKRTRVKNALRALLRSRGIEPPKGLWSKEGLAWLRSVRLPDPCARMRRRMLLEELRLLGRQVKDIGRTLGGLAGRDPHAKLLRTMPGVGERTSEAVVAWIDDPQRFPRSSRAASYFGLVPRQDQTGDRNRLGGISKAGPTVVRWLLVEAAWRAVRKEGPLRDRYQRLLHGDPQRKRKAVVAVARHMSVVMLAMLRDGRPWTPELAASIEEETLATT